MKTNWLIPVWTVMAMIQTYAAGMAWDNWIIKRGIDSDYGNLVNLHLSFTTRQELITAMVSSTSAVLVWALVIWKVRSRDKRGRAELGGTTGKIA